MKGSDFGSVATAVCLETRAPRRVRARGLQETAEIAMRCRPGALTGRVFKHALRKLRLRFGGTSNLVAPTSLISTVIVRLMSEVRYCANARAERCGRPSASELPTDAVRPHSLQ